MVYDKYVFLRPKRYKYHRKWIYSILAETAYIRPI